MKFQHCLQYKMLRLVGVQAAFFIAVLSTLWLINPKWVFWHIEKDPIVTQSLYNFKHHYGLLNTLNMQLAQQRGIVEAHQSQLHTINEQLNEHIQGIKQSSITAQQHFELDFTVLVHFLYHYKSKVAALEPGAEDYADNLWQAIVYFSRIQSEFFYIVEEIDRFDTQLAHQQLQNAQSSLLIWALTSFGILLLGAAIATNYARVWKKQISQLLEQIYRIKNDDFSQHSSICSNDELGLVASALNEVVDRIKEKINP